MSPRKLILAVGNPLREDDGIGAAVLEMLQPGSPGEDVSLVDGGTAGLDCALLWEGFDEMIVVDAADMGMQPGEWRQFSMDEIAIDEHGLNSIGAVHAAGIKEALALGRALGNLPPVVIIFGVQPDSVGYGGSLSQRVRAAIPELCEAVRLAAGLPDPST